MGRTAPAIGITFLGTGSGVPSLERNLACMALQRQGELFLFDCGEAAQIQYRRAGLGFAPLTGIAISHLHGDHVTGLMGLLMSLQMADRTEPLHLFGPPGLAEYVDVNRRCLQTGFTYDLRITETRESGVLFETPQYRLLCAPLEHRGLCLGFRFEERPRPGRFNAEAARALDLPEVAMFRRLQQGESIRLDDGRCIQPEQVLGPPRPGAVVTYCTDTRPCTAAVDLAENADLLIYEGTFDADRAAEARRKAHSTVADAARTALAARVDRLVITHLSPRYLDTSPLLAQARAIFPRTQIARDLSHYEVFHRETVGVPAEAKGE